MPVFHKKWLNLKSHYFRVLTILHYLHSTILLQKHLKELFSDMHCFWYKLNSVKMCYNQYVKHIFGSRRFCRRQNKFYQRKPVRWVAYFSFCVHKHRTKDLICMKFHDINIHKKFENLLAVEIFQDRILIEFY